MFKTYKRKIHVFLKTPNGLFYAWSTNAYQTCREAVAAAKSKRPKLEFRANFARGKP